VNVHFLGVWWVTTNIICFISRKHPYRRDTVSSVASADQGLHLSNARICFFRQALALDERRVKFLPEYVHGGVSLSQEERGVANGLAPPPVKEVWFAGNHSNMYARCPCLAS